MRKLGSLRSVAQLLLLTFSDAYGCINQDATLICHLTTLHTLSHRIIIIQLIIYGNTYTVGKISRIWELRGANIRDLDPNPKFSPKT